MQNVLQYFIVCHGTRVLALLHANSNLLLSINLLSPCPDRPNTDASTRTGALEYSSSVMMVFTGDSVV